MADYPYGAQASDPAFESGFDVGQAVTLAGAALSLALIAGVGVWSYRLVMRDVTGVPVVQAIEGPMRVAPENPGGEVALNRGLSVNAVPAEGIAGAPKDRLVLAPRDVALEPGDLEAADAEAGEVVAADAADAPDLDLIETAFAAGGPPPASPDASVTGPDLAEDPAADLAAADGFSEPDAALLEAAAAASDPDAPLTAEQIIALADQIAAGVAPLDPVEAETAAQQALPDGFGAEVIPASIPGVAVSPRPVARPMRLTAIEPTAASSAAPDPATVPIVDPAAIVPGEKLAQLGAFESPEIAEAEWERLNARFGDFMGGRARVIQQTETGGTTLWRLRAHGFEDLAEAQRFCAALVAEEAVCIPLVVR